VRTFACDADAIMVTLPACAVADPARYSASLSRPGQLSYVLGVTLVPPSAVSSMQLELVLPIAPAPRPSKRGSWTLSITTPCGCYSVPMWLDTCAAPALPGVHTPTRLPVVTACTPEIQPDLTAMWPLIGLTFARSADGLRTGIDGTAVPPYGQLGLPAPTPAVVVTLTAVDATGALSGSLSPTVPALNGQGWRLIDRHGRVVTSGIVAAGALTAALAAPLGCGQHYLAFGSPPPP
jgi:hypothetical protein